MFEQLSLLCGRTDLLIGELHVPIFRTEIHIHEFSEKSGALNISLVSGILRSYEFPNGSLLQHRFANDGLQL